jgi:predicted anti-sigma-YlaC factor YlaD
MTIWTCDVVRDAYPDALNGRLDAMRVDMIRAHVASCDECRSEIEVLDAIHAQSLPVPAGLEERVLVAALQPRRPHWQSRGILSLAATVALALIGGSILVQTTNTEKRATRPVGFVSVENAMLTGKASLDDYSVAELEQLLEEIDS